MRLRFRLGQGGLWQRRTLFAAVTTISTAACAEVLGPTSKPETRHWLSQLDQPIPGTNTILKSITQLIVKSIQDHVENDDCSYRFIVNDGLMFTPRLLDQLWRSFPGTHVCLGNWALFNVVLHSAMLSPVAALCCGWLQTLSAGYVFTTSHAGRRG